MTPSGDEKGVVGPGSVVQAASGPRRRATRRARRFMGTASVLKEGFREG
jgi:hypothetical protein